MTPAGAPTSRAEPAQPVRRRPWHIAVATLGSAIEWMDFTLFGLMALTLAQLFFPTGNPTTALLASLGTFGSGFLARPLGAAIFGQLGDVLGRRIVLAMAMAVMSAGSLLIGLSPTHAQAGIAGSALLIAGRLLQGISAGAEFGNAVTYMVEWAPPHRRGLYGSFHQFAAGFGTLMGVVTIAATTALFTADQIADFAWRLPFLLAGTLALIGAGLRLTLPETPEFARAERSPPVPAAPGAALVGFAQVVGICALWAVAVFGAIIYMPAYLTRYVPGMGSDAPLVTLVSIAAVLPCIIAAGHVADRFEHRTLLIAASLAMLAFAYPGYLLLSGAGGRGAIFAAAMGFGCLAGFMCGVGPVAIAERFPVQSRSLWTSLGSALSITLFGGFAPFFATLLIESLGWLPAPSLYMMGVALVTLGAAATLPRGGPAAWRDASDAQRPVSPLVATEVT